MKLVPLTRGHTGKRFGGVFLALTLPVMMGASQYPPDTGSPEAQGAEAAMDLCEIIEIEAEATTITGSWELRSDVAGHSGTGYLFWTGPNLYQSPGDSILSYKVVVLEDAVYRVHLRALRQKRDREIRDDLENDVWIRADDQGWIKTFFSGPWDEWVWTEQFDFAHYTGLRPPSEIHLTKGEHVIEISGRSEGVHFDRLVLVRADAQTPTPEPEPTPKPE